MPSHHEILQQINHVLEILKESATPLSVPPETPAGRAFYALSSLYFSILLGVKTVAESGSQAQFPYRD
jgi:hypothetical protein